MPLTMCKYALMQGFRSMLLRRIFIVMLGLTYCGVSLKVYHDLGGMQWLAGAVIGAVVVILGLVLVAKALRERRGAGEEAAVAVPAEAPAPEPETGDGEASAISAVRARLMARSSTHSQDAADTPVAAEAPSGDCPEPPPPAQSDIFADATPAPSPESEIGAAALRHEPGFPWAPRFIGIWAREVLGDAPDDLRGLVSHWIRWADSRPDGEPIVEEAAGEFALLVDNWPWDELPGSDANATFAIVASRLVEESADDPALAAILPQAVRDAARG